MDTIFSVSEHDHAFFDDAVESIDRSAQLILEAEKSNSIASVIQEVFRTFHTIKGGAQMVGCEMLAIFAHQVEDLLDQVRSDELPADKNVASLVLDALTLMEDEIAFYRQGRHPKTLANRQTELLTRVHSLNTTKTLKVTKVSVHETTSADVSFTNVGESSIVIHHKYIYYIWICIDESAPMPEICEMLFKQRLEESGSVHYFGKRTGIAFELEAILRTDLEENELSKNCNLADIKEMLIHCVSSAASSVARIPLDAVKQFQKMIGLLDEMIRHEESSQKQLFSIIDKVSVWCKQYAENFCCVPAGRTEWERALALLRAGISLWNRLNSSPEQRHLIAQLAQNFWEEIYANLENRVYYYCIHPTSLAKNAGLFTECKQLLKGATTGFAVIDLSSVAVIEVDGIDMLAETVAWIKSRNIVPILVAKGDFRHRHNNALEALSLMHEGLTIYSSTYSACVANYRSGKVAE